MTVTPIKTPKKDNSVYLLVAIGLFTYERAESQIYRAQDSQTIPVKLKYRYCQLSKWWTLLA